KRAVLKLITSMIDLTTLEGMDTPGKVRNLCQKGMHPLVAGSDLPSVAAICVYPSMVATAVAELAGTAIHVASVATAFPSGQAPLDIRLADVKAAVAAGADEIDMVINRGAFLRGDYATVYNEIMAVKAACGDAHLKVILETGELQTLDQVRKAAQIGIDGGGDFIKTSTGKVKVNATMPVTLVMLETIRDHYLKTGVKIGMKPAGGIRTAKQAWHYLVMVKETLGDAWLTNELFRFGASSLLNDVLMQWMKLETGRYQSADYFSID
ncbi:MAG TPA: deoxyribose-phosphate aldolase, partial [Anaerolineae bacterium]|nr:deoxyribose-phosphate aldolase [Anaerolineae bacterium]